MKSGALWPWALGSLIAIGVVVDVGVAVMASSRGITEIDPGYGDSAQLDQARRERLQAGQRAGLALRLEIDPELQADGKRVLRLQLVDRDDQLIDGSRLRIDAWPNAWPSRSRRLELSELAPGRWQTTLLIQPQGRWQLAAELDVDGRSLRLEDTVFLQ